MRLIFDIVMMILSVLGFSIAYFFDRDGIFVVIIIMSIIYWGLLYFACRKHDALVSNSEVNNNGGKK